MYKKETNCFYYLAKKQVSLYKSELGRWNQELNSFEKPTRLIPKNYNWWFKRGLQPFPEGNRQILTGHYQ